jgi:dephospho-CoA kinase
VTGTGAAAFRVGLTGGIASGKSTVAGLFAELGAEVIDTDSISRELVRPGSPLLATIVERFGADLKTPEGALDRRRLRAIVFADPGKRRGLEAILHPPIRAEALARAAASTAPYVILVVPLLFESGFDRLVDARVVVDCPEPRQIERLVARDRLSEAEARSMLAAQMTREERTRRADEIIDNSGSLASTRSRVRELHERYLQLATNCPSPRGRAEYPDG